MCNKINNSENIILDKLETSNNTINNNIINEVKDELNEEKKEEIKEEIKETIVIEKKKEETKKKLNKKFLGLTINEWGWLSMVANLVSVIFQLYNLYKTQSAQSFSMKFIFLMIILNFWYFLVAILHENIGFAIATFAFVLYNCIVVYVYYFGKQ